MIYLDLDLAGLALVRIISFFYYLKTSMETPQLDSDSDSFSFVFPCR